MPVLLLLPVALAMTPPATLAILPTLNPPAATFKMDSADKPDSTLRGLPAKQDKAPPASFVDAEARAEPDATDQSVAAETEMLEQLDKTLTTCEADMDTVEAENVKNNDAVQDMHKAAHDDMNLEEANRHQINKLTHMYSLLTKAAVAEEQVQGVESSQQSGATSDAAELAGKAAEENRMLDGSEDSQETQRTQLNVVTGNLNQKVQESQEHTKTLVAWSMQVASNTNVATGEMADLRSLLLTLDDLFTGLMDNVISLYKDVHEAKGTGGAAPSMPAR